MHLLVLFVDGLSIRKKNDGNFASCTTRNDPVSRHFFFLLDTSIHNQKIKCIALFNVAWRRALMFYKHLLNELPCDGILLAANCLSRATKENPCQRRLFGT
jgi:hypothetical protein